MLEAAFTCVMRLRPPLPLIHTLLTTYSPPVHPQRRSRRSRTLSGLISLTPTSLPRPSAGARINLQLLIALR